MQCSAEQVLAQACQNMCYSSWEMWLALVSVNSEEIAIIISYIIKEEENILQQKQKWKT